MIVVCFGKHIGMAPIIFCKLFMVFVSSKKDNSKKLPIKKISEIFTPSQEEYVLLELKNSWGDRCV